MRLYLVINPSKIETKMENLVYYLRDKNKSHVFSLDDEELQKMSVDKNHRLSSLMRWTRKVEVMGYGKPEYMKEIVSKIIHCPKNIVINYGLCF